MGFIPKPSEAIETNSGLLQDADVRVIASEYTVFDFNGKGTKDEGNPTGANLALTLTIRPLTATDESEDEVQNYVGAWISKLCPAEVADGDPLTEVGQSGQYIVLAPGSTASGILKNTNMMLFLRELVNAQFPEDKITEKADFLVGLEGHWKRIPLKKKDGTVSKNAKGYDNTVGVFSRILKFPWEKAAKGGSAPAAKGGSKAGAAPAAKAGATASASAATYSPEDLAHQFLNDTLAASTTTHTPADLKKSAFGWALRKENFSGKAIPDPATRKAFCELLVNDEFLLTNSAAADDNSVYNVVDGNVVPLTASAA